MEALSKRSNFANSALSLHTHWWVNGKEEERDETKKLKN
jgi:hypothetical protein